MAFWLIIAAVIALPALLVALGLSAPGPMTIPATRAAESSKKSKKKEFVSMNPNLPTVSGIWEKAWRIQLARIATHPTETHFLERNAQVAQANYVMALAEEAVKAGRI